MLKREHKVSNISSEAIFAIPAMKPIRVIFAVIFCFFLMITDIRYDSGSYLRSLSYDLIKPVTLLTRIPSYLLEVSKVYFSSRQTLQDKARFLEQENLKLQAINNSWPSNQTIIYWGKVINLQPVFCLRYRFYVKFGSPGRIRTAGQAINSRLLYR